MLWLSAPICLLMTTLLPETSSATILYKRGKRLQKATGNQNLKAQAEIDQAHLMFNQIVYDALIKPVQINVLDPAVLFSTLYTSLVYGIFYSFFESFPLAYMGVYHFSFDVSSLPFLGIIVAAFLALLIFCLYWYYYVEVPVLKGGFAALKSIEQRLSLGLFTCWLIPAGLFLFGKIPLDFT